MAIETTAFSVVYDGNNSTETPYPFPFPYIDGTHLKVIVDKDTDNEQILSYQSEFLVEDVADQEGRIESGNVTTVAPVAASSTVTVERQTPLTQLTEYPETGPFPARSHEAALDKIHMILQEMVGGVVAGDVTVGLQDVLYWATEANRGAVAATRVGQLGVQGSDDTIWIAQSTTAGDWVPFNIENLYSNRIEIGVTAATNHDHGYTEKTANIGAIMMGWDADAYITAGDVWPESYTDELASLNGAYGSFDAAIDAEKLFPALGVGERLNSSRLASMYNKFAYLPGNRRYYDVVLGGGLVHLFVLNSDLDDQGNHGPDENMATQSQWLIDKLATSRARWRIAVMDWGFVTTGENSINPTTSDSLVWGFEDMGIDLLINGRSRVNELIVRKGLPILGVGGADIGPAWNPGYSDHGNAPTVGDAVNLSMLGETDEARVEMASDFPGCWKFNVTPTQFEIEFWQIARNSTQGSPKAKCAFTSAIPSSDGQKADTWEKEVWGPDESLTTNDSRVVGRAPRHQPLQAIVLTCPNVGASGNIAVEISINGNDIGVEPYVVGLGGVVRIDAGYLNLNGQNLHRGDLVEITIKAGGDAYSNDWEGLSVAFVGPYVD